MLRHRLRTIVNAAARLYDSKALVAEAAVRKLSRGFSSKHVILDMDGNPVTAGIVIIGDEIIKGQVQDANSFFLSNRLHRIGVDVKAIITIPDDLKTIARYVKQFSGEYTYVITAGGIGPTHDDITYEAVAAAFDDVTEINDDLEKVYKHHFKERYTEFHRKLAKIPKTATLVGDVKVFPITSLKNVYVLPGVPKFLQLAFEALESLMENPSTSYKARHLYLGVDEMSVTSGIMKVNELFQCRVAIGSYPEWHNNYYKMRISLESTNEKDILECEAKLKEVIPPCHFVLYDKHPKKDSMVKLRGLTDSDSTIKGGLEDAIAVFREALDKYAPEEICLGFNGGKDCTVLLHIWYAVLKETHPDEKMNAIYIRCKTPFPELETFIEDSIVRYEINMLRFEGNIKDQLTQLKLQHPHFKAVIMGTRASDPHGGGLKSFHPTDEGWPKFMRLNPILKWRYNDIWYFLRQLSLPYCSLYDVGYTSLGSMENTHPNPALRYTDSKNVVHYKAAHTLVIEDDKEERAGRTPFVPNSSS